jgi:hypothetical protein
LYAAIGIGPQGNLKNRVLKMGKTDHPHDNHVSLSATPMADFRKKKRLSSVSPESGQVTVTGIELLVSHASSSPPI